MNIFDRTTFFHDIGRYFICFHSSIFNNHDVYTYVNVINKYRWYFYLNFLKYRGGGHTIWAWNKKYYNKNLDDKEFGFSVNKCSIKPKLTFSFNNHCDLNYRKLFNRIVQGCIFFRK